jgi:hypothetical protein
MNATLAFSAIDYDAVTRGDRKRAPVRTEHTTVAWRRHGMEAWTPLSTTSESTEIANGVDETSQLGHIASGTLFHCNLSPVSADGFGAVDLTFHLEDPAGNSLDYTLAPAFVVTSGDRTRAVRH